MKKSDTDVQDKDFKGPVPSESKRDTHEGIPIDESSKFLMNAFEKSLEKLEPGDREAVMDHHSKLMKSMTILSEKMNEIFSSEEGRRLFQQELQNRGGSKK